MTVVALARGEHRNALVVDWVKGVPKQDGSGDHEFDSTRCDKMLRIGNTFVTVVGDDQALAAAYTMGVWLNGRCPEFRDEAVFHKLVTLTNGFWEIHKRRSPNLTRRGFTLVICASDVAFYRRVSVVNGVTNVDAIGFDVGVASMDVIYGGKRFWGAGYNEQEEGLVDRCIGVMARMDERVRKDPKAEGCEPLPYPFPIGWSSVVVPTDGTTPKRMHPFTSPLAEQAWQAALADLAQDQVFTTFDLTAIPCRS